LNGSPDLITASSAEGKLILLKAVSTRTASNTNVASESQTPVLFLRFTNLSVTD
jgi:hypothetical protein